MEDTTPADEKLRRQSSLLSLPIETLIGMVQERRMQKQEDKINSVAGIICTLESLLRKGCFLFSGSTTVSRYICEIICRVLFLFTNCRHL